MSISGSSEVKSAILNVSGVTSGSTETTQIDAQEDREIVGMALAPNPSLDGEIQAEYSAFIGTDPDPGNDDGNDNRSFFHNCFSATESDETNGIGSAFLGGAPALWMGHGSGVEWNEDATLTAQVENTSGSSAATSLRVVVYYREI